MFYVFIYLLAAVLANLSVAYFGPSSTIVNAFLFIGLDLTSRDKLHEAWGGKMLWLKMLALIVTGSALSWFINKDAGQIAIASLLAFLGAGIVDSVVYQLLHKKDYFVKVNGSNFFSAIADSIIFPTVAFGSFLPVIVLGQFLAKLIGGFVWSLMLSKYKN